MTWTEFIVDTKEENEESFAQYFNTLTQGCVIEHSIDIMKRKIDNFEEKFRLDSDSYPMSDIRIKVYFDEFTNASDALEKINQFIDGADLIDKVNIKITQNTVVESDWENEWKKYFHSFRVSDTFVIVPSWEMDAHECREGDRLIKLDPGMAFGTGDHPTTSMCLTLIEDCVKPHHKVIDVGTGSGILSIGSFLMGARDIKATDIDELSLKVAAENAEINECSHAITLEKANLLIDESNHYDVIIANILAHIVDAMLEDAYKLLNPSGMFIASGIVVEKRDDIVTRMETIGFTIERVLEVNGWVSILGTRCE